MQTSNYRRCWKDNPVKKYPKEIAAFIKENVTGMTTNGLTALVNERFGTSYRSSQIRAYKKNHNLLSGTPCGLPAGRATETYPADVREFIRNNYLGIGHQSMADLLNDKFGTSYTKGQMKGIYARFKLNSGRTGRFSKGHKPIKCIQKGWRISPATEFTEGHMPHNYRPVGSEVLRTDGYVYIKIADPKKWRQKHVLIWEAVNGPKPDKHRIIFSDGNRLNFDIDNLILVSWAQLCVMNHKGLIKDSAELTRSGVIIADIYSKMAKVKRRKQNDTKHRRKQNMAT